MTRPTTLREFIIQRSPTAPHQPISFAEIVAVAIKHTPFGLLGPADRAGLIKRARSMGLTEAQAIEAIAAQSERPRAPVTRGIE